MKKNSSFPQLKFFVLPFLILLAITLLKINDVGGEAIKTGTIEDSFEVGLLEESSMSNSVELAGIPLSSEDADSPKDSSCKSDDTADESDESPKDTGGSSGNANASVGSAESETSNKDCGEGKFLNPKTGRCKNLQTVSETTTGKTITTYDPVTGEATVEKICNEGYELNAETNRCKKVKDGTSSNSTAATKSSASDSTKKASSSSKKSDSTTPDKDCGEGKFLNPKTGRCKNLQTVSESSTGKTVTTYDPATGEATTEKICNEGYELDKDSNRCKKKKENKGDDFAMEVPELGNKPNFVAIGSVILIAAAGIGFVIFEFRHEIVKFFKKFKARRTPKDML